MSLHPMVPWWLWAVLTAAGLAVLARSALSARAQGGDDEWQSAWVRVAMAAVLAAIVLHPGVGRVPGTAAGTDLDVLVVLDHTTSMSAEDWGGRQRLDGARTDLTAVAEQLAGSRFALLTFGRLVQLEMPFSTDTAAFDAALAGVRREEPFEGQGSSPGRALPDMRAILARDESQHPERHRVVLLVTDGEVTERGAAVASFAPLAGLVDGGAVIGYGTADGGRMRVFEDQAAAGNYVYDNATGSEAISRIDERTLRRIAGQLGIPYVHSTPPGRASEVTAGIERSYAADASAPPARLDLSWALGLVLGLLALVEGRRALTEHRAARAEVRTL